MSGIDIQHEEQFYASSDLILVSLVLFDIWQLMTLTWGQKKAFEAFTLDYVNSFVPFYKPANQKKTSKITICCCPTFNQSLLICRDLFYMFMKLKQWVRSSSTSGQTLCTETFLLNLSENRHQVTCNCQTLVLNICKLCGAKPTVCCFSTLLDLKYITSSLPLLSYSLSSEASEQTGSSGRTDNECWTTERVIASVWPAAPAQKLAQDLCTNLSIRVCRLPSQNSLSQLSFYINYSGKARDSPESLVAEFQERPSGVMSKKRSTVLQLPTQFITSSALTMSTAA